MEEVSASVTEVAKSSGEIAQSIAMVNGKNEAISTEVDKNAEGADKLSKLMKQFKVN